MRMLQAAQGRGAKISFQGELQMVLEDGGCLEVDAFLSDLQKVLEKDPKAEVHGLSGPQ